MRYIIENGQICDGSGEKVYKSDILIEEGRIKALSGKDRKFGQEIEAVQIDAGGKTVTPGFIDTHRHCDLAALYDEDFGNLELAQGLTSIVGGNCGLGIFPCTPEHKDEVAGFVEPCLGVAPKDMWVANYKAYMELLAQRPMPLHVGCYQGVGALKAAIKGYGKKPFTAGEMELAKAWLKEALEAGCIGVSSGIMYQPECYSSREEMVELLKAAASYGRPLACHIRGEGDNLVSSVAEIIRICREAGLPLNISHFKATGIRNWGKKIHQAIELIEEARAKGQDVTVDFYPYCGGSTTLLSLIPPDVMEEDLSRTFRKMETAQGREALKDSLYREHPGWDNMVTAIGWERIKISSVTKENNRRLVGLDFASAARMEGFEEPAYFMARLLAQEEGKVGIILLSMDREDVDTVAKLPYSMLISDGLYGVSDCPHPRLYGSFPHFIQEYVIQRKIFSLEEAVRKMTAMSAARLGLKDRGLIREGFKADLNIFTPEELKDHAVYEDSKKLCTGLSWVFVDGHPAWKDGQKLTGYSAELLRK